MYRTHTCGELRIEDAGKEVTLAGWVQHNRDLGAMTFITLRDRYGVTQLIFNMEDNAELCQRARELGREYVVQARGKVVERSSPNPNMPTGLIEIAVEALNVLNPSLTPPFTIEDETDGSEELRMKYRYLDLRRRPVKNNIILRHRVLQESRKYLSAEGFLEIETPFLVKSTPEGARDFVVPSRMHEGQFYALPQSPQTFKQLLMMAGFDKYFQVVKCFRDEDLRADRQPEFTQIDCEMSFVNVDDIINTFTGLMRFLMKEVLDVDLGAIPQIPYDDAMKLYGSDKPDLRFSMPIQYLETLVKDTDFAPFKDALDNKGSVAGINVTGGAGYTRKQLDTLTDFVKEPHRGLKGLIWVRHNEDGTMKSSADKFFTEGQLREWLGLFGAEKGDLLLIGAGPTNKVQKSLGDLRLEVGDWQGLRKKNNYAALWVVDFPMFEWNEEHSFWSYMHHPFTSPRKEDVDKLLTDPGSVKAYAYDFVLNGTEVGGGSIRIHDRDIQNKVFQALGLSEEEISNKFGFLLKALEYGAPPHAGIAFGFDRLVSILAGTDSIREVMAFPKNNAGRDLMMDAPSEISGEQLKELHIKVVG
jgi:aspartyl-tRNA synthetase